MKRSVTCGMLFACVCVLSAAPVSASSCRVEIGTDGPTGSIKPVNGVGQPPMIGAPAAFPMMHFLKEAGIPFARLHDVGGSYGQLRYVDIPNVFRDFGADENDPKNYSFSYTDSLVKSLVENGVEPFFRLGVTIDNTVHQGYPGYFIDPPADFAKWARVCEHVIRHYTEGWARGFRYKIAYWEIWNEPDNELDRTQNPMWRAPFSEYMRFYGVVAPYLKKKFPHLKIGGYGSCGFYAAVGAGQVKAANSSPRLEHFVDCATNFLAAARTNGWPLDFFSFHSYSEPNEAIRQVRYADALLTEYGFARGKTERVFNEWLPYVGHGNLGSARQAAGIAAELIELQNGPCDLACIYDARCGVGNYSPLFNPMTYRPHKAYYAFMAFNELRKRGRSLRTNVTGSPRIHAAAASGMDGVVVMLANDGDVSIDVACVVSGKRPDAVFVTDAERTWAQVADLAELQPHSFALVIFPDARVVQSSAPSGTDDGDALDFTADAYRPQLRFTQRFGWANDPNGLIWWNGAYHFFHQHVPFGVGRGPKCWNHAVSKDLVHWEELGDVLVPDALGEMWSGSAVCDRRNTAGFGADALVLVYTAWRKGGRQCLAASSDGRAFAKYAGNPVIENINGDDRDPLVFWHEPTQRWVMALYGKENDAQGTTHHVVWFFTSADLKAWRRESTYFGGVVGKSNFLCECPLVEELKVEGEEATAWLVAGAAGDAYSVGSFDGCVFTPQEERIPWESPMGTYAAQTFRDDPQGWRIAVSWLMLPYRNDATYRHSFSLPREMALRRTSDGLRLVQRPVRELASLRSGPAVALEAFRGELAEIVLRGDLSRDAFLSLDVRGMNVVLDAAKETFSVGGQTCRWTPRVRLDMTLYVDRVSAEAFGNDGLFWTTFPDAFPDAGRQEIKVLDCRGIGSPAFTAYPLSSAERTNSVKKEK